MADATFEPSRLPPRLGRPGALQFATMVAVLALVIASARTTWHAGAGLATSYPHVMRIVAEMLPPDLSRIGSVLRLLVETVLIAVSGTVMGVAISGVLVAPLAASNVSPHPLVARAARAVTAFCRTVPELVWALFFVATVGLGPVAGTLALMMEAIGFCGRFFADAMEEADPGPQEALLAGGASRPAVVLAAVVPAALPSLVNVSLFAFEKAVRSSVVLGLVGAGGIGNELEASFSMFEYRQASTVILAIFVLVLLVEQASERIRKRLL